MNFPFNGHFGYFRIPGTLPGVRRGMVALSVKTEKITFTSTLQLCTYQAQILRDRSEAMTKTNFVINLMLCIYWGLIKTIYT